MLTDDGNFYFPTNDGHFISERQRRVNEILQDYDPTLELQWIPPGQRNEKDEPFRVIQVPPGKPPYLVCTAQEADERLLATVFQADARNHSGSLLNFLDAYNSAREIYHAKIDEEKRQEAHELAAAVIRNPKSSYIHNGVDFERPGRSEPRKTHIWR